MTPRLTIAIPTVNRASLLAHAIESALAQTSSDIEIIVSDNGSTDDTPAVIERYAGLDSRRRIRTFRHPTTMSAAKHGQFLVEQAQGQFFVGLSDDDFLEPEFAAEVLALYDQHPELSFVYTGCAVHYEDCQVPALVGPPVETGASFLAAHYSGKREVSWCACAARVRDLVELGPQPEDRVIGDMFFWTKLAFRGPVGCIPRVLSHYVLLRPQNDNISHGTPPVVWARESRLLADEVIEASRRAVVDPGYISRLQNDCRSHISRSTANQFVWARIRGARRMQTWSWIFECIPYLSWNPVALSRVTVALVLPMEVLRRLLLKNAAKLAVARGAKPQVAANTRSFIV
ncbi:MAG: glycosyltransferase family A protein [Terriglobales bacterium]|jgi:glycosyltransferase involved in cell wall biosynthesis